MVDYSRLNEESNNEIRLKTRVHSIGVGSFKFIKNDKKVPF